MKTRFSNISGCGGQWRRGLATAALLALGLLAAAGAPQFNSPAGTWDFLMTGCGEQGIAFITFTNTSPIGGFFRGFQVQSEPLNTVSEEGTGGRNPAGNPEGRNTTGWSGTTTVGTTTNINVYGFTGIQGPWEFDSQGRVIGYFVEVLNRNPDTTVWLQTMVQASIAYTFTNGGGPQTAITNFVFTYTNAPFTTNLSWTSVNADGSTNQYSQNFVLSPTNAALELVYAITNTLGQVVSSTSTNFDFDYLDGQITNSEGMTTETLPTNVTWTVLANSFTFTTENAIVVGSGTATNQISFVGTVVPGKRMTIVSAPSVNTQKITYRGIPYNPSVPDLSGNWYAIRRENTKTYVEFFYLQSFASGNPFPDLDNFVTNFPNIYFSTNGYGPGYTMTMVSMLSHQKQVGFYFNRLTDDGSTNFLSATYGPLTTRGTTARANMIGLDGTLNLRMSYSATQQP